MACPRCAETIKRAAVVCKHCGWKSGGGWSTLKKVALWPLAALILLIIYGAMTGPKTYAELADDYARHCIAENGMGTWVASSGATLETHCKLYGSLRATEDLKRDHPEKF